MKSSAIISVVTCLALGYATLPSANGAGTIDAKAGAPGAKAAGAKAAGTNAEPASLPVPESVFDLAATPMKDPFFPNTVRVPFPKNVVKQTTTVLATYFHLTGLSGVGPDRLAIINHRTMAVGEDTEVSIPGNKATVRIVQFKETSVVIRVVNPPQPDLIELSLSKHAQ